MAAICIVKTHFVMNELINKASTTTAADSTFGFFWEIKLKFSCKSSASNNWERFETIL